MNDALLGRMVETSNIACSDVKKRDLRFCLFACLLAYSAIR